MSQPIQKRDIRPDIQVLRAFAVGVVLVSHLWPNGPLAGGYLGVDVFFVISGFLITSHLVEHVPTNHHGLLDFWGRRVRRLLPASLAVLAATAVASWLWLPESQWLATARQIRAAATYWVNWALAADSVDYFAAGSPATPVQHYWSLSVEEQFYLVWPVLILLLTWLGWRLRERRWLYFAGLLVVVGASLWFSITYTRSTPAAAYFVSTTRVWELGAGGLLAVAQPVIAKVLSTKWGERSRIPVAYAGWLLMAAAVWRFNAETAIPGWRAAIPVAGALLVLAANAPLDWYPVHMLQWLGDHSYSIYLWHWPLLVIEPAALQSARGWKDDVAIIVATLVLAALTKRFLEDPVRNLAWWRRLVPTYAMGALGMAVVIAVSVTWTGVANHRQEEHQRQLADQLAGKMACFGAAALDPANNCAPTNDGGYVPDGSIWQIGAIERGKPGLNDSLCNSYEHDWRVTRCDAGDLSSPVTVVLTGNSHALQWLEALSEIAEAQHWHLVTYYATGCPFADWQEGTFLPQFVHCGEWGRAVLSSILKLKPTLVVTSNLGYQPNYAGWFRPGFGRPQFVDVYTSAYRKLSDAGIRTVVIRDAPSAVGGDKGETKLFPNANPISCLGAHPDDYGACSAPRSEWEYADPAVDAVNKVGSPMVTFADFNDRVCGPVTCYAVVGGVRVWQDRSHLTGTYVHTMIPYIEPVLVGAVASP
ncbi:acyltransferase family protein [Catellatospora chokoriensis]|uniref:Acyltransferase n=1 Tax=Catellatospora chokoriensis TaxID=310353 RepID=A0A8J3K573_9ACTN|nr:acyltransferase family protein [Catellatospora chokoriensis]GIF88644.1 acyltransferase [Catellatospora chokoriensis]